jgi:hypothetical protein
MKKKKKEVVLKVNLLLLSITKTSCFFSLENESIEEIEEEQISGKKKIITIPLHFKPIEMPRGTGGPRGGQRRGGNRFRPNRDEQPRCKYFEILSSFVFYFLFLSYFTKSRPTINIISTI